MIFQKAIQTVILDYCLEVVFERFLRNFRVLTVCAVDFETFGFFHYSKFKAFLKENQLDFAFHNFVEYTKVNGLQMSSDDTIAIYIKFWEIKEEEKALYSGSSGIWSDP